MIYELIFGTFPSTKGKKPETSPRGDQYPDLKKWFDECTQQEPILRPKSNDLFSDIEKTF